MVLEKYQKLAICIYDLILIRKSNSNISILYIGTIAKQQQIKKNRARTIEATSILTKKIIIITSDWLYFLF